MPPPVVTELFWRVITRGDFFNIERASTAGPVGGGGQRYIDVPLGGKLSPSDLGLFLTGNPFSASPDTWPTVTINARAVGQVNQQALLEFAARAVQSRYKISNQNRQASGSRRHPAWRVENGFPQASDTIAGTTDPSMPDVSRLKVFVAKTEESDYYAGYVNTDTMPAGWPTGVGLEVLFQSNEELIPRRTTVGIVRVIPESTTVPSLRVLSRYEDGEEFFDLGGLTGVPVDYGSLAAPAAGAADEAGEFNPENVEDGRQRAVASIVRRRGQPKFRQELLDAYGTRCAITDCDVPAALEAVHITPYKGDETNRVGNGLLLRADIHTLFDLRVITIDPDTLTVRLSPSLQGSAYGGLEGRPTRLPGNPALRPSPAALRQHRGEAGF